MLILDSRLTFSYNLIASRAEVLGKSLISTSLQQNHKQIGKKRALAKA